MTTSRKILWVRAFPEPHSLNGSLRSAGIDKLVGMDHQVVTSPLYEMGWNPVVTGDGIVPPGTRFNATTDSRQAYLEGRLPHDVSAEQEKIRAADAIVVQFPLWWYGLPAILKGWIDRVFISGFAFGKNPDTGKRLRFEQGPFRGKRVLGVMTLGDRERAIGPRGKSGELHELLFGLLHGTFAYTGMDVIDPVAFPSADFTDSQSYYLAEKRLGRRLSHLFDAEPIPYRPQFQGDYTAEWDLEPDVRPNETGLSVHVMTTEELGR